MRIYDNWGLKLPLMQKIVVMQHQIFTMLNPYFLSHCDGNGPHNPKTALIQNATKLFALRQDYK